MTRNQQKFDKGSVIILFALLLGLFLALLGFVIDIAFMSSAKNKQEFVADYSATAALAAYYSTDITGMTPDQAYAARISAAQTATGNTAGLGANALTVEKFDPTPRAPDAPVSVQVSTADPNSYGNLIPGTWWPLPPQQCDAVGPYCRIICNSIATCQYPCGSAPYDKPCFRENLPGENVANAFKVELKLPTGNLFATRFAQFAGATHMGSTGSGIATLIPRRMIFLIDASASVTFESHPYPAPSDPPSGKIPFAILLDSTSSSCASGSCTCSGHTSPCASGSCRFVHSQLNAEWDLLTPIRKSDYTCVTVNYTADGNPKTQHYLVDMAVPPEPLTSILTSMRKALDVFLERGVAADRVGAIVFDNREVNPKRYFNLDRPELSSSGTTPFDALYRITNTDRSSYAQWVSDFYYGLEEHILFPRYPDPLDPAEATGVNTDIPAAVQRAQNLLKTNEGFALAENSISLMTDGFTNCYFNGVQRVCPGQFDDHLFFHNSSLNELNGIYANSLATDNIALHIALIGSSMMSPHTLVRQTLRPGGATCMDDVEARAQSTNFINQFYNGAGQTIQDSSCYPKLGFLPAGCTGYYWPNRIYLAAKKTKGLFIPVIEPCVDAPPAGDCAAEVQGILTSACAAAANGNPIGNIFNGPHQYTDSAGRLLCNPECKTKADQITDAFDKILGSNPYVLVDQP